MPIMRAAGEATRERILVAAKSEFARYGVAGARINRIAAAAHASKDRLYAYFPGKSELYAAVTELWAEQTADDTDFTADDLPGYIGRLFDHFITQPEDAQLQAWAELEPSGPDITVILRRTVDAKVAEMRRGQREGLVTTEIPAALLLRMLTDLARTAATHARHDTSHADDRHIATRRAATVLAAQRIVAP